MKMMAAVVVSLARHSAWQAQEAIEGGLERRRRGVLGPPDGTTACVFVDDVSMPTPEASSAQPPVELLRQVRLEWNEWTMFVIRAVTTCAVWFVGAWRSGHGLRWLV